MPTTAKNYRIEEHSLPGVIQITPSCFADERGFFAEIYNEELFKELGISTTFVQDAVSCSEQNVLRGLHFQKPPHGQAKLVRCTSGKIFDVAVDVDPASPTYRQHVMVELSGKTQSMLFIPGQYAHGFLVMSGPAIVEYKMSAKHNPESSAGVLFDDPVLSIDWPSTKPILSENDKAWTPLP